MYIIFNHKLKFIFIIICFFNILKVASAIASLDKTYYLSPTVYYIKSIKINETCASKKTIYNIEKKSLYKVCLQDYKNCVIEGTCAILNIDTAKDDKAQNIDISTNEISVESNKHLEVLSQHYALINYVKIDSSGEPLFTHVNIKNCPFGYGVSNTCLDPYYSVAADLKYHKAGDVIFIESVKGLILPNQEIHQGFFIIRDKGGAIKGPHRFDFFTGLTEYQNETNLFTNLGLASKQNKIKYRKATSSEAIEFKKIRNYPLIPESESQVMLGRRS